MGGRTAEPRANHCAVAAEQIADKNASGPVAISAREHRRNGSGLLLRRHRIPPPDTEAQVSVGVALSGAEQ